MPLTFRQYKGIEVNWDKDVIKGGSVSISAKKDVGSIELRDVENDGHATIAFPDNFTGQSGIVVKGSKKGEESGVVHVV